MTETGGIRGVPRGSKREEETILTSIEEGNDDRNRRHSRGSKGQRERRRDNALTSIEGGNDDRNRRRSWSERGE